MQLTTLLTALIATSLVGESPAPLVPRSDWYQTFYASSDCSGTPIQVVDDASGGCTHLSTTAYSVSSTGLGCCGAWLFSAASDWDCSNEIGNAQWIAGNVSCTAYPDGVKEVTPGCC